MLINVINMYVCTYGREMSCYLGYLVGYGIGEFDGLSEGSNI